MHTLPTINEVKSCIAHQPPALPEPIERLYQEKLSTYRGKSVLVGILPSFVIFNAFIPLESFFVPGIMRPVIASHALISLWMFVVAFALRSEPRPVIRECLAVSIPALLIAHVLAVFLATDGAMHDHCHYLAIAILIDMNVNLRPAFRAALVTSIAVAAFYALSLALSDTTLPARATGAALMALAVYVSLEANRRMGRDARAAFLRQLLERLLRVEAESEAGTDALTGLANRRRVETMAASFWRDAAVTSQEAAVILVDVDHFKDFNDHFGHPAGDRCLIRVATAIADALRQGQDTASRFGGEEFLLLLPQASFVDAARAAERVRRAVENLAIPHVARSRRVTVSLGVAAGPTSLHSFEDLMAAADTALYAAKRDGRNRVWPPIALLLKSEPGDEQRRKSS